MIQLDQNAGLPMDQQALQIYTLYTMYNNIYGYGDQKRQVQQDVEKTRKELCSFFGFDRVIYNSGAMESIYTIFRKIPNIHVCAGQHPSVNDLQAEQQYEDNICISCLVSSSTSQIQLSCEGFSKVVLDVTQAIGKIKYGSSQAGLPKQGEYNVQCMFFSTHKLGGPKRAGFFVCSNSFFDKYIQLPKNIKQTEEYQLHPDLQIGGTFDISGFMSSAYVVLNTKIPSKKNIDMLQSFPEIKNIQPEIKEVNNINDYPNAFSSITFQLENICPRSFQHLLENNGIQIGFETACQSNKSGTLRMSWRQSGFDVDIIKNGFKQALKQIQMIGGKKLSNTFLDEINDNKFWLVHHFVPAHDLPPNIDQKYEQMFQPDLLKQQVTISLKIPPHNDSHMLELDVNDKIKNNEDYEQNDVGIRIQNRHISKYLWINKQNDVDYELSLENFEKETIQIQLTDQVFELVEDNVLNKKQRPIQFQEETKFYDVEIKNYPQTLLQEIIVKYQNPQKKQKMKKRYQDKRRYEQSENEENESNENENKENENKENESKENESNENENKENYIHEEIKFLISSYNLKLLTFLGGNHLSIAILNNLNLQHRRGETPSRFYIQHQCIVQDLSYLSYNALFSNILNSMKIMKQIDNNYPKQGIQFNKPDFSNNMKQIIIQQLNDTNIEKIIQNLPNDAVNIVIYLPNINEDEINETYGLYHYFIEKGFKYEIDFFEYYDVWTHVYHDDKEIVKFYK